MSFRDDEMNICDYMVIKGKETKIKPGDTQSQRGQTGCNLKAF